MRLFLHIDMDYFFAACEELRHPELKGKPLAVGTSTVENKLKGVVQTCNYEARKLGIHSAMPTAMAFKLCPALNYMPDDWRFYSETSARVMDAAKSLGFRTEVISVDEAVIDLGEMDYAKAEGIGRELKSIVNTKLGLPCTLGISVGKSYAKMVCDASKPNGLGVLREDGVKSFLKDKEVTKLLGIGGKTAEKLEEMKITTIGELAKAKPLALEAKFGSFGKEMYLLANGIDNGKVIENAAALSIGRERTFDKETKSMDDVELMLKELAKEVMEEVSKQGYWFRGVGVKARYYDRTERLKNRMLPNYTDSEALLLNTGLEMIRPLIGDKAVRKVGIRIYELNPKKGQRSL